MLKRTSLRTSLFATHLAGLLLGASASSTPAVRLAPASDGDPGAASETAALAGATAVARAEEWVSAKLQYCQSANHQRDYDDACTTYCERTDNAAWDPYRSDCSGLISWAWQLPAPGRVTGEFAPFQTDITHTISASSLSPGRRCQQLGSRHALQRVGDAGQGGRLHRGAGLRDRHHPRPRIHHRRDREREHHRGRLLGKSFTAIRYDGIGSGGEGQSGGGCVSGGLYCGGDKVSGDSSALYRCNGTSAPTVVEKCANGCSVNAGQDDSCKSGGGTVSGGSCVSGGLTAAATR